MAALDGTTTAGASKRITGTDKTLGAGAGLATTAAVRAVVASSADATGAATAPSATTGAAPSRPTVTGGVADAGADTGVGAGAARSCSEKVWACSAASRLRLALGCTGMAGSSGRSRPLIS